jgi:hypothetical protein
LFILSSTETLARNLESSLNDKRPELILVLSFGPLTKLILSQIDNFYFSHISWAFSYKLKGQRVVDDLNDEFKEFRIDLSSRWFVLVDNDLNKTMEFYEIYKKSKTSNLTISQLCSGKIKFCTKPDFIWKRRKDLSGVHFQVAVHRGDSLLQNSNGVSQICNCQHDFLYIRKTSYWFKLFFYH